MIVWISDSRASDVELTIYIGKDIIIYLEMKMTPYYVKLMALLNTPTRTPQHTHARTHALTHIHSVFLCRFAAQTVDHRTSSPNVGLLYRLWGWSWALLLLKKRSSWGR